MLSERNGKPGGDADGCENKGVVKIGIQKLMKIRKLKIDCLRGALRVAEEWRDETGTLSANLGWILPHPLLFVK